ncbi:hypothetical protein BGZ60DRAFT_397300 [Tricladium varicosporioides]|nr:hypothetical protein BGZ60DRAFT_397300 [Hymenoscyphus varicosporioides]
MIRDQSPGLPLRIPMELGFSATVTPSYNASSYTQFYQEDTRLEIPLRTNRSEPPLTVRPCPQCKGLKYGFTAYFHNTEIFSKPPHELLPYIEQSYLLKNRLKTLLVDWVMHPPIHIEEHTERAGIEIQSWGCQVETLLRSVLIFGKSNGVNLDEATSEKAVEELVKWCGEIIKALKGTVYGGKHSELPERKLKNILSRFRQLWESVWIFLAGEETGH